MDETSKLDNIDIQQFSAGMKEKLGVDLTRQLEFSISEMKSPWKVRRAKSHDDYERECYSGEALFYLLIGETKDTFFEGIPVPATVVSDDQGSDVKC
jgi:hypothetical protein